MDTGRAKRERWAMRLSLVHVYEMMNLLRILLSTVLTTYYSHSHRPKTHTHLNSLTHSGVEECLVRNSVVEGDILHRKVIS